ncbi:MAG: hypothetical protein ABL903_14910 [Methylococcales bacterium]
MQLFLKAVIPAGMFRRLPSLALDTCFPAGMTHFFASVAIGKPSRIQR